MAEEIYINLEFTPNPNTLKFQVNRTLLDRGAANFKSPESAQECPLAQAVFKVEGIAAVMVGTNFVTITRTEQGDWDHIAEAVPQALEAHLRSDSPNFLPSWEQRSAQNQDSSEIARRIREILDTDIRPAVAMDGGDITFDRFEDGVVYLHMQGACSSCPSSTMTLKMGVENRLRDQIPEVREVVQV